MKSKSVLYESIVDVQHRGYLLGRGEEAAYYNAINQDTVIESGNFDKIKAKIPEMYRPEVEKILEKGNVKYKHLVMDKNLFGDRILPNDDMMPNLFIIGPPRSGTTFLHTALRSSPDICGSNPKESKYFNVDYHLGKQFFLYHHFRQYQGEKYKLYSNPNSFNNSFVANRIAKDCPNSKVIIGLRNPFERMYSHWHIFDRMYSGRSASFEDCIAENARCFSLDRFKSDGDYYPNTNQYGSHYHIDLLESSLYDTNTQRYVDAGLDDSFIYVMEHLDKNSENIRLGLQSFLNIEIGELKGNKHRANTEIKNTKKIVEKICPEISELIIKECIKMSHRIDVDLIKLWGL